MMAASPSESKTYMIRDDGKVGLSTAPSFIERIHVSGFCYAGDLAVIILVGPSHGAIRPT